MYKLLADLADLSSPLTTIDYKAILNQAVQGTAARSSWATELGRLGKAHGMKVPPVLVARGSMFSLGGTSHVR